MATIANGSFLNRPVTKGHPLYLYSAVLDHKTKKSACQYYRIEVPMRAMDRKQYAQCFFDDGRYPQEISLQNNFSADIWLMFAAAGEKAHYMVDKVKELKPGLALDGKTMRYPPSIVYDIDDNLDYVHPFNPTFSRFGIRAPDGTKLKPGDVVACQLDGGRIVDVWEDKITKGDHYEPFDIERNIKFVASIHELAQKSDGATFPSKYLGKWYEENWGVKDWYFYPNSVVEHDYPTVDLKPHEGVRVIWQGGMSHAVDWYPVKEALGHVITEHPESKLIMWGSELYPVERSIHRNQYLKIKWMDYGAYKPWRVLVDADINLCPLVDNDFNRCKSAIKWYEASILCRPEATLAANVPPYSDEIVDGETGLLYNDDREFAMKLATLIENKDLRVRLAENARKWVLENRAAEKTVDGLNDYYQHLREKKVAEFAGTQVYVGG